MGKVVEYIEEEWEKPVNLENGGEKRKCKRTTNKVRVWSAGNSKSAMMFAFGIMAAAILNLIASLR